MPTLEQYRNMLRINKLRLDDELEIQAETQYDIGAEVARLTTRMLEAENQVKVTEADLLTHFKDSGAKATVEDMKAAIRRHPDRARAWEKYLALRETVEMWEAMHAAWVTRGYKLADTGSLFASDYFAIKSVTRPDGTRTREVNAADEDTRSAIRRASERKDAERSQREEPADDPAPPRRRSAL